MKAIAIVKTKYPVLLEVNTRVWLTDLSHDLGRPITLEDIPDRSLDAFAEMGFDWIWFMGVWTKGELGQSI